MISKNQGAGLKSKQELCSLIQELFSEKYTHATFCFFGGSHVRQEATEFSDVDLVVVYPHLEYAFRESFLYKGIPFEVFHHDEKTLLYFMDQDAKRGRPSMPQMVKEGIVIPSSTEQSHELKKHAASLLRSPPKLSREDVENQRYAISDIVDDLRAPRSRQEAIASGVQLYPLLANFYLRAHGNWGASGKWIPRVLSRIDPEYAKNFQRAFDQLFQFGIVSVLIAVAEETLSPFGGCFFDGYRRDAPADWRKHQ